jgi:hypothetical protein
MRLNGFRRPRFFLVHARGRPYKFTNYIDVIRMALCGLCDGQVEARWNGHSMAHRPADTI